MIPVTQVLLEPRDRQDQKVKEVSEDPWGLRGQPAPGGLRVLTDPLDLQGHKDLKGQWGQRVKKAIPDQQVQKDQLARVGRVVRVVLRANKAQKDRQGLPDLRDPQAHEV